MLPTFRSLTLALGPPLLVALCYWTSASARQERLPAEVVPLRPPVTTAWNWPEATDASELETRCREAAERLQRFDASLSLFVRPPFVLAGDESVGRLEHAYVETIAPLVRALSVEYFDRQPRTPIVMLLLADENRYAKCLATFAGTARREYAGVYVRAARMVLLNASTGDGTLAHELTHALAHADAPDLPEWFDEGLASLHEECVFSADGLRLEGQPNWRGAALQDAERRAELPHLRQLVQNRFTTSTDGELTYAHTRYLCLFLQERQLLAHYYRKLKLAIDDPTGERTLQTLFGGATLDQIDAEFVDWLESHGVPSTDAHKASRRTF